MVEVTDIQFPGDEQKQRAIPVEAPKAEPPKISNIQFPGAPVNQMLPGRFPDPPPGPVHIDTPKELASTDPQGMLQAFAQPFRDYWPEYVHARYKAADEFVDGINEIFKSDTLHGKAFGALQVLGGTGSWVMSPVEGFARAFAGNQMGQITTNITGSKRAGDVVTNLIGDTASLGAQFVTDPIVAIGKGAQAIRSMGPLGESLARKAQMKTLIRDYGGQLAQANRMAAENLDKFQMFMREQPQAITRGFIDAYESGTGQVLPELDPVAGVVRKELEAARDRARSLGVLEHFYENYFPHFWKNPSGEPETRTWSEMLAQAEAKSPLRGSQAFRKKRKYDTFMRGIDAGLVPVTEDPLKLAMLKINELNKFYYGSKMAEEMKASGLIKFYPSEAGARFGMPGATKLDDRVFKAMLPPARVVHTAVHQTAFDPTIRRGLQNIANHFGFQIRTPLTHEDPLLKQNPGYLGYANLSGGPVISRFGNELQVMEHEVGHQIDAKFNLWNFMAQDNDAWHELGQLALKRIDGFLTPQSRQIANSLTGLKYEHETHLAPGTVPADTYSQYLAYLMNGRERMANFFHAYWYAPELLRHVAPNALAHFEQWMEHVGANLPMGQTNVRDLIKGVLPSLATKSEERQQLFEAVIPGWRHMGDWYGPAEIAKIFNNYVSKGWSGHPYYNGIRSASNFLNQSQLSLSAFHAFFTTLDTMISRVALGLEQVHRGVAGFDPAKSRLMEVGRGLGNIAVGVTPIAPIETAIKGRRFRKAYLDPAGATPLMAKIVDHGIKGGVRINMDKFWQVTEGGGAIKSVRGLLADYKSGEFMQRVANEFRDTPYRSALSLPFKIAGKVIQDLSHPIMEYLVPAQKMGVFHDLAADFIRRNPNATTQEIRIAMSKALDSVDNRLGQMVYDNVFWSKTAKDIAFLTVRSVGWNLGTIRELGGAVPDTARAISALRKGEEAEFTHRMAYAAAMPAVTALYGATLTYLYTGEGPKELRDYFFPPTGKINDQGARERVIIPSYVKDVLEYDRDAVQTLKNKINPMWGALLGLWDNKDFYGAEIINKDGGPVNQTWDFIKYGADQMTPFSIRSARKMSASAGATRASAISSFAGLQAAPGFITNPELQEAFKQRAAAQAKRKRARREQRP